MRRISAPSTMKRVGSHHRFWILPPLGLKPLCLGFFFCPAKKWTVFLGTKHEASLNFFFGRIFFKCMISLLHIPYSSEYIQLFQKWIRNHPPVTGCAQTPVPTFGVFWSGRCYTTGFWSALEVTKVTHVGKENVGLIWRSPKGTCCMYITISSTNSFTNS